MPSASTRLHLAALIRVVLLVALLCAPVLYAYSQMGQLTPLVATGVIWGAFGICLLLWALGFSSRFPLPVLIALLVCTAILIRLLYMSLIIFSGAGFNADFFLHLELGSIKAAWYMYGLWLVAGTLLLVGILAGGYLLARSLPSPRGKAAGGLLLAALLTIGLSSSYLPEAALARAAYLLNFKSLDIPGYSDLKKRWQYSTLVETRLISKNQLQVSAPETPKNLILVYLESVGTSVATHPDWPDLMPELSKLIDQYSLTPDLFASSFITIEGITNSQCGTLFPFDHGSDSLANGANLAENMPCLGDILAQAGYNNLYMGGAEMGFAGKGDFLLAHGYDDPMGYSHWTAMGIHQRPGTWGVSDVDLFDYSLETITQLRTQDQPFNLTLLTIGTHLPGFTYEECDDYPHSDNIFLNALHCSDQLLHSWLQALIAEGVLEDTVIVITADHHIFNNPAMRQIFKETVYDRRLPFVVLGAELPTDRPARGAGYDIAPTVLDLLNIDHNVTFPLGRSLLREQSRPDFYITRHTEIEEGVIREKALRPCTDKNPTEPHKTELLTACQREDLYPLLRRQIESFSSSSAIAIQCRRTGNLSAYIDPDSEPMLALDVEGVSLMSRFTQQGQVMAHHRPGLYMAWFDKTGRLENMTFSPVNHLPANAPGTDITRAWIAIWYPNDSQDITPPDWLQVDNDQNGIYFGSGTQDNIHWLATEGNERLNWQLNSQTCRQIFSH